MRSPSLACPLYLKLVSRLLASLQSNPLPGIVSLKSSGQETSEISPFAFCQYSDVRHEIEFALTADIKAAEEKYEKYKPNRPVAATKAKMPILGNPMDVVFFDKDSSLLNCMRSLLLGDRLVSTSAAWSTDAPVRWPGNDRTCEVRQLASASDVRGREQTPKAQAGIVRICGAFTTGRARRKQAFLCFHISSTRKQFHLNTSHFKYRANHANFL